MNIQHLINKISNNKKINETSKYQKLLDFIYSCELYHEDKSPFGRGYHECLLDIREFINKELEEDT